MLSAFGFSALLFSFVALAIMNPENVYPTTNPEGQLIYDEDIAAKVSESNVI